ncbi:MAG TPA: LysR family transcriptional regulator [Rhizomicrobium sp.]|jgi:DNA-binding transcriptional LysR family regulator|nr:LysR family transcriptional regulator [Rhizomicrobium sp.]
MAIAWDHYRSFLAVVREGSLSAAARVLGLTQPTLGRHVDELETSLNTPLFARSPHGLAPTAAALELVPHAEAMASAAEALLRAASGEGAAPRGVVRVTASEVVGVEVLPPILTAFREQHPQIVIELAVSNRNQDLLRRDADIAVRMARPTQGALIAKRIGKIDIGLYAHKRYLKRHGTPKTPEDLLRHAVIGFDRDISSLRSLNGGGMPITREIFAFRSDNDHAQLAAMRAGFGILAVQSGVASRERELVRVLPNDVTFSLEMWLAMHEDLRMNRRVRLLFDHLAAALTEYAAIRG